MGERDAMDAQGHDTILDDYGNPKTDAVGLLADKIIERLIAYHPSAIILPDHGEEPTFERLWQRLDAIEKATRRATGLGLPDIPIDAETAAAITGLAVGTVKKYGCYKLIDTIRIGDKLQFSLKACIRLIECGTRKAVLDCTTDITSYKRKKRTPKGKVKRGA
jgi:hypothetical protein